MKDGERAPRPYRLRARALAAEETGTRIVEAALELFRRGYYDEVTLQEVAARSGVTLQTVIRRFGSKEGLVRAVSDHVFPQVAAVRGAVEPGDVEGVLEALIPHYEEIGDSIVRLLAIEGRIPAIHEALQRGREFHRSWLARTFASFLPPVGDPAHARRLALFVVATDLLTWKVLRREQGLSQAETALAMREMLERLLEPR